MSDYKVWVRAGTENALVPVRFYDHDAEIIPEGFDDDGNEIYEISVNGDIDTILDGCQDVISYERLGTAE